MTVRRLNLLDLREVLRSGAELARTPQPPHLYARALLGELTQTAREDLWLLARMAQRRGGLTMVEVPVDGPPPRRRGGRRPPPADPDLIAAQIAGAGGQVVEHETTGDPGRRTARIVARWDGGRRAVGPTGRGA